MDKKTAKKLYLQYGLTFLLSPNLKAQFADLRREFERGDTDKLRRKLVSEDYARASRVFQLFDLDPATSNVSELDKKLKEYTLNPLTGRSEPSTPPPSEMGLNVAPPPPPVVPKDLESLPTGGPSLWDLVKSFGGDPSEMTREDMIKFLESKT